MDKQNNGESKDIVLEAIRGLAAIIVMAGHSCMGFLPQHTGVFSQYTDNYSWQGFPLFFLINGGGAVPLFFVLSGYVLTRRYFATENVYFLLRGVIKRWPRLMGPVLMATLISYILFKVGAYFYEAAGSRSGSPWLIQFAWASDKPLTLTFSGALIQGFFLNFFRGDYTYDSSLWTMRPEFIGSFVAFGLAPIFSEARKISAWLVVGITGCVLVMAHFSMPNLVAFPIGVATAALLPRNKFISQKIGCLLLLVALYLIGYSGSAIGIYSILSFIHDPEHYRIYLPVVGATDYYLSCRKLSSISTATFRYSFSMAWRIIISYLSNACFSYLFYRVGRISALWSFPCHNKCFFGHAHCCNPYSGF